MGRLGVRDEKKRAERDIEGINPADYSEALERGLAVFAAFDAQDARLTQADLARKLDLPRATVRRSLVTLVHLGYMEADGRTYRLTPKVLGIASAYLTTNPVSRILQPMCERLSAEFGTSCTVAVLEREDAVMIARALPHQSLTVGLGMGYRIPASRSALGRVLLSSLGEGERHHLLDATRSAEGAAITGKEHARIEAAIAEIREQGYSYVANEVDSGFHSVAVPLRRWDGQQIAALNIGATLDHLSAEDMQERVRIRLQAIAEEVQSQLI